MRSDQVYHAHSLVRTDGEPWLNDSAPELGPRLEARRREQNALTTGSLGKLNAGHTLAGLLYDGNLDGFFGYLGDAVNLKKNTKNCIYHLSLHAYKSRSIDRIKTW